MSRTNPGGLEAEPSSAGPPTEKTAAPVAPESGVSGVTRAAREVPTAFLSEMEESLGGRPKVNVVETSETHGEHGARYAGVGVAVPRERVATEPLANIILSKTVPPEHASPEIAAEVHQGKAMAALSAVTRPEGRARPKTFEEAVAAKAARRGRGTVDGPHNAPPVGSAAVNTAPAMRPEPAPDPARLPVAVEEKNRAAFAVVLGVVMIAVIAFVGLWWAKAQPPVPMRRETAPS